MAAKIDDVVFQAGQAVNMEELWDDSALIKAYEKAVNSFKLEMEGESGIVNQANSPNSKKKKRRRKSKKREDKSSFDEVNNETRNTFLVITTQHCGSEADRPLTPYKYDWSVGDKCLAVYSEDGLIYDAEVMEICSDMCVVRYFDYGNEEQQYLTDLMPAQEENITYSYQNEVNSDAEGLVETNRINWRVSDLCVAPEPPYQHYHEAVINSFSSSLTCKVTFIRSRKSHEVNVKDLQRSCDFHPSSSDARHQPHYNANLIPPMPPFPSHGGFRGIPQPPVPPPPPPISLNDLQSDDEPLASMLMSWYLSGYHTGYFKAVQQFKRNHASNCSSEFTSQQPHESNINHHSPGTNMDTKE